MNIRIIHHCWCQKWQADPDASELWAIENVATACPYCQKQFQTEVLDSVLNQYFPHIGPDPLRERDKIVDGSPEGSRKRLMDICSYAQPKVPDQTMLCWRADVSRVCDDLIWRRAAMDTWFKTALEAYDNLVALEQKLERRVERLHRASQKKITITDRCSLQANKAEALRAFRQIKKAVQTMTKRLAPWLESRERQIKPPQQQPTEQETA